jgi:hypothetical protein
MPPTRPVRSSAAKLYSAELAAPRHFEIRLSWRVVRHRRSRHPRGGHSIAPAPPTALRAAGRRFGGEAVGGAASRGAAPPAKPRPAKRPFGRSRVSTHPAERSFDCVRAAHRAPRGRAPLLRLRRGGAASREAVIGRSRISTHPAERSFDCVRAAHRAPRGRAPLLWLRRRSRVPRSRLPVEPPSRGAAIRSLGCFRAAHRAPRGRAPLARLHRGGAASREAEPHPFRAAHRAPRGRFRLEVPGRFRPRCRQRPAAPAAPRRTPEVPTLSNPTLCPA